jgi:hypothetical protein
MCRRNTHLAVEVLLLNIPIHTAYIMLLAEDEGQVSNCNGGQVKEAILKKLGPKEA